MNMKRSTDRILTTHVGSLAATKMIAIARATEAIGSPCPCPEVSDAQADPTDCREKTERSTAPMTTRIIDTFAFRSRDQRDQLDDAPTDHRANRECQQPGYDQLPSYLPMDGAGPAGRSDPHNRGRNRVGRAEWDAKSRGQADRAGSCQLCGKPLVSLKVCQSSAQGPYDPPTADARPRCHDSRAEKHDPDWDPKRG